MKTKVSEVLEKKGGKIITILASGTLKEAVGLFNAKRVGALIVMNDDNEIQGIVTERDVMIKLAEADGEIKDMSVKMVMTPKEKLIVGTDTDTIEYLMKVMTNNRIRHIPILDNASRTLVGLVSIGDLVKSHLGDLDHENKMLKDYIEGSYPA